MIPAYKKKPWLLDIKDKSDLFIWIGISFFFDLLKLD